MAELLSSSSRTIRVKKIDSIQVLRGIAAFMVTVYHTKDVVSAGEPFKSEIDFLFNSGPAGVACFFVISGFIMVYITPEPSYSPKSIYQFVIKRIARIWPTYAVLTCLFFVLHHHFNADRFYVINLVKSLFFIPLASTDAPFYGYATLSVGWSLNYEIYFYLLVAISMFFGRWRWWAFFALLGVTLIGIPAIFGYLSFRPDRTPDFGIPYLNMITNPVLWNFGYGIILGLLYRNPVSFAFLSRIFLSKTVAYGLISLVMWQYFSGFFAGHGPLQWGLGAFLLVTAFLFYHENNRTRFAGWLVDLGDISFSVYLMHLPVLVLIPIFFNKIGFPVFGSGLPMLFLAIALTLVLSSLSHKFLERRLSELFKNSFPGMKKTALPKASVSKVI